MTSRSASVYSGVVCTVPYVTGFSRLGLTPEDAMAFGDGNNDIEMFQAVGHSVAMGNASADLKAIASEVCGTCAEDGIYHYCKENGLI